MKSRRVIGCCILAVWLALAVGPALARRIVAHRETHGPFRSPADLLQVSGVGAKRYARLQGMIHTAEAP